MVHLHNWFMQNLYLFRSVPQVFKVWMPSAYTFIKLVHILWLAAAVILTRQFPVLYSENSSMRCFGSGSTSWSPYYLTPILFPRLHKAQYCEKKKEESVFSHYVVVCRVQTAGAVRVFVVSPSWWAVLRDVPKAILYLLLHFASQNYNSACCFVWMWNLVADIEGGTQAEGVWE